MIRAACDCWLAHHTRNNPARSSHPSRVGRPETFTHTSVARPTTQRTIDATAATSSKNAAGLNICARPNSPRASAVVARVSPQVGVTTPMTHVGICNRNGGRPKSARLTVNANPNMTIHVRILIRSRP